MTDRRFQSAFAQLDERVLWTDRRARRQIPLPDPSRRFIWPTCGMLKPIIASPEAAEGISEGGRGALVIGEMESTMWSGSVTRDDR